VVKFCPLRRKCMRTLSPYARGRAREGEGVWGARGYQPVTNRTVLAQLKCHRQARGFLPHAKLRARVASRLSAVIEAATHASASFTEARPLLVPDRGHHSPVLYASHRGGKVAQYMSQDESHAEHAARGARTQALYRDINERVREINQAFSEVIPFGDWVCESAASSISRFARSPASLG
jgi:hypothetical protein